MAVALGIRTLLEHRDVSKGSFFLGRNIFGWLTVMAKATKQNGKEKVNVSLFPLFKQYQCCSVPFVFIPCGEYMSA